MRQSDRGEAGRLEKALVAFERDAGALPGLRREEARTAFVEQMVESVRRGRYLEKVKQGDSSALRKEPGAASFDPHRAAVLHSRAGDLDEAAWLVFLATHFGKHRRAGWAYARAVYGARSGEAVWTWSRIREGVDEFRSWMDENAEEIRSKKNGPVGFGNHRKYESLNGWAVNGTGACVAGYVGWIGETGRHVDVFGSAQAEAAGDPRLAFDALYRGMRAIPRFGRTARFDYLMLLGRLGIQPILPGRIYLDGATGPASGAKQLLGGLHGFDSVASADEYLATLAESLGIGCDTLEDALCNWQKSPDAFRPFRG